MSYYITNEVLLFDNKGISTCIVAGRFFMMMLYAMLMI